MAKIIINYANKPHINWPERVKWANYGDQQAVDLITSAANCKKEECETEFWTGTAMIVHAARVALKNKLINTTDLSVIFITENGAEAIVFDKDGRSYNWPKGFCDQWDDLLSELL